MNLLQQASTLPPDPGHEGRIRHAETVRKMTLRALKADVTKVLLHVTKVLLHVMKGPLHETKDLLHVTEDLLHETEDLLHVTQVLLHETEGPLHVTKVPLHVTELPGDGFQSLQKPLKSVHNTLKYRALAFDSSPPSEPLPNFEVIDF